MTHLILCREYPPAPYPAGGIGTYSRHIARLLAESGERVHVIAQRWDGAPQALSSLYDGRLLIHRISLEAPLVDDPVHYQEQREILQGLALSTCPTQLFAWQAARYVERLLETKFVDVIEAPEWEASLYYLMVRRALGLGPVQKPPCIVHLHSPTRMIFEHNQWDMTLTDFGPLCRLEEYTIRAADALICPSRYLAEGVTASYELERGRIDVIPYPMGDTSPVRRELEVWKSDAICYVGRLELRKGVIEWVEAAVQVAASHPTVSFDFFGNDTTLGGGFGASVLESLRALIPTGLRPRFRFHGGQSRESLLLHLSRVAIAVVPSRWENFPFTCIEAMAAGLPLIVSPCGGMVELVTDAESGWIAPDGTAQGLAVALLRALATPASTRKAMGQAASTAVRSRCANEVVLQEQLAFRQQVVTAGATRSCRVGGMSPVQPLAPERQGMGIVVTCLDQPQRLADCLHSIIAQSVTVTTVVVVAENLRQSVASVFRNITTDQPHNMQWVFIQDASGDGAVAIGIAHLRERVPQLRSVALLDQNAQPASDYAARCESAFALQPSLGLVSPWLTVSDRRKELDPGPCPLSFNSAAECDLPMYSAVRLIAIPAGSEGQESRWLKEGGWTAVTYPGLIVTVSSPPLSRRLFAPRRRYSGMALIQSGTLRFALMWFMGAPWGEKLRWLGRVAGQPRRALSWVRWRIFGS